MHIEINAIAHESDANQTGTIWQQAYYLVDGEIGKGLLGRYLDADGEPQYTDNTVWNVRHDARCVANGRAPHLDYVDDEGDERIDAVEDAIRDAWARWDREH